MRTHERAAQIWPVLTLAAHNRQVLTYDLVGKLIGVPRQGLGQLLEPIQSYCLIKKLPALTVLVVKSSGLPGDGFIAAENVGAEQSRVFNYDWLSEPTPTVEQLEEALRQRPSCGIPEARECGTAESVGDRLLGLARWAESRPCDLPEDLAANHDHYLHGLAKRK